MDNTTKRLLRSLGILGFVVSISAQSDEFNKIDAFTSATKYLRIDSVLVYKTKAIIYWNEYWPDDMEVLVYQFKWGKVGSQFEDSINLEPYIEKTTNIDTIQPLVENTRYYGQINRDYNRRKFNVDFPFNTPPLPNKVTNNKPAVFLPSGKISGMDVFSIEGKRIATTAIPDGNLAPAMHLLHESVRSPGLYVVNFRGKNGSIVRTRKMLFGRRLDSPVRK